MKKILLVMISALLLSSCAASPQANSEYDSNDIMFAEMMIPHHEQAIEMSELALVNTSNPEILTLAEQIKNEQAPEIEIMKSWSGVNASMHGGHMMDGMLSGDELSELQNSKGAQFDQLFLQGMIKHHQGAIEMAEGILSSMNKEVSSLAASIIKAQELEIATMQKLLVNP